MLATVNKVKHIVLNRPHAWKSITYATFFYVSDEVLPSWSQVSLAKNHKTFLKRLLAICQKAREREKKKKWSLQSFLC